MPTNEPKYVPSLVVFIDILGFRTLIEQAEDPDFAHRVIDTLDKVLGIYRRFSRSQSIRAKLFSDCMSLTGKKEDTLALLLTAGTLQTTLSGSGIFVRGGVAYGKHYESENIIFSEALVKAYHIESQLAIYPRIVLDDEVMRWVEDSCEWSENNMFDLLSHFITRDSDGIPFIDYLVALGSSNMFTSYADLVEPDPAGLDFAIAHRNSIQWQLERFGSNRRVAEKYAWLRDYHNRSVHKYFRDERPDLNVTV